MEPQTCEQHRDWREHPCHGTRYLEIWEDNPFGEERMWVGVFHSNHL